MHCPIHDFGAASTPSRFHPWMCSAVSFDCSCRRSSRTPARSSRRVAVAQRESDRRAHIVENTRVQLAAAARRTYYDLYFAERAREVHHQHLALVRELSSSAETRYATGSAPQENVLRALQELTGLFIQLADVDARLAGARAALNALLRRDANAPMGRSSARRATLSGLQLEEALAAAKENPGLAAASVAIQREEARVAAEWHEAKPDFGVAAEWWTASDGLGGRFERYALLATITLPWANGGKYEAAVIRATADQRAAVADRQAREDEVRRDVVAAWHRVTASARIVELYMTTLLPQSETTLEAARSAYETAATPFVTVIDTERALLFNRLGLARAEADYGISVADLAEAIGVVYLPNEEPLP